jgi:hypothetical protein
MSIAAAGLVSHLAAADLGSKDAEFLFGQSDVNVVAMSSMEMVQTEGQVLEVLSPVLGLVGNLPLVGPIVGDLTGNLLGGDLLSPVTGLVAGLPLVGPLVGDLTGNLLGGDLLGSVTGIVGTLPVVGALTGNLPVLTAL